MLEYHSAIKVTFTQIALIAAVKGLLWNPIKNNAGITLSLEARLSWRRWRQPCPDSTQHKAGVPASALRRVARSARLPS